MKTWFTTFWALTSLVTVGMAEVGFHRPPVTKKTADGVSIAFAVTEPTDVEVAIVNDSGNVIRHLAAGRLGPNATTPFRPGQLEQEILWDGRNDAGKQVQDASLRVRVRLGLSPRLDKIIGWSGQQLDGANGVVAGPRGTLYVIWSAGLYAHRQTWLITAFDRDGRYLRQVFPGPANLPPEKRKGWPRISLDDGSKVPVVCHLLPRTTYPGAVFARRMFPVLTNDDRMVMLTGPGHTTIKYPDLRGGRRLLILGTDGSVPQDFLGPEICPLAGGAGHIALSPDDKYVYATGFVDTGRKGKGPCNVVYRVALDGSQPSNIFLGSLYDTESGKSGLEDPQGIATDSDGNVYVADYGHNRIAVFKPDGSYLDEIPVECPDSVIVSRKSGAIYVMQIEERGKPYNDQHYYTPSHNWRAHRVIKFASLSDKTEMASFANELKSKYGGGAFVTLDESGPHPVVWVTGLMYLGGPILKLIDRGDRFELSGAPISELAQADNAQYLGFIGDVAVVGDRVISRHPAFGKHTNTSFVYSAETGEYAGTYVPKKEDGTPENMWSLLYGETVAGRDGNLYVHSRNHTIRRYDAEGNQLPFSSTGTNVIEGFWHGHTRGAGMFIDAGGRIYVPAAAENRGLQDMKVKVVGPDGKIENDALIEVHGARIGGIAVDRAGNVYLGAQVAPKEARIPPWFAGKLPADSEAAHPSNDYKHYGMIFKFPPTGGRIFADPNGDFVAHCSYKPATVSVEGALWMRRLGCIGTHGHELGCHCETTRFDLDDYGRLFVPDIFRFCVFVLDSAGNEITRIGSYGNMDSRGPGSPVPQPDVPFGWPLSVQVAGNKMFVADLVNRRVVAVKLDHAATATCDVE